MFVSLRTGEMFHSSTAGLAVMTTTALSQDHPPPQVASQFEKLFRQRHRLVEIGQKIAERVICHGIPLFDYSKLEIERIMEQAAAYARPWDRDCAFRARESRLHLHQVPQHHSWDSRSDR